MDVTNHSCSSRVAIRQGDSIVFSWHMPVYHVNMVCCAITACACIRHPDVRVLQQFNPGRK
eukprot:12933006-Ditylum_brightwellii.AAC.1